MATAFERIEIAAQVARDLLEHAGDERHQVVDAWRLRVKRAMVVLDVAEDMPPLGHGQRLEGVSGLPVVKVFERWMKAQPNL